jgi:hypothetical protein
MDGGKSTGGRRSGRAEDPGSVEAGPDLLELVLRRLDHRQAIAADAVPEQIQRGLDRDRVRLDLQELVRRRHFLVEAAGAVDVALAVAANHLIGLRAPDVGVHTDAADAAQLEEREDEIVVTGVQIEPELDDPPRLREVGVRLLHRTDVLDRSELGDRLRLDVHDDPAWDVVDDDRLVGTRSDLLEVPDDRALRRLVVVRRHDEKGVDAELVCLGRQLRGVGGVVRARAGDDRGPVAHGVDCGREELELLPVAQRRALARGAGDDEAVGAVIDEEDGQLAELLDVDGAVGMERRHDRGQHFSEHERNSTAAPP